MSDITKACRDITKLTPEAQKACNLFLEKCKQAGLNVLITETYRSQARQNYLYTQGRTRGGKVVTWTHNSRHTSRRAWDICKNVKGQEYSDPSFFRKCGEIAAELGITWGGIWKSSPDTPHFEIAEDWKEPSTHVTEDKALFNAVTAIIKRGVQLTVNAWRSPERINLNNVPALVCKLGGIKLEGYVSDAQYKQAIDKLVGMGVISERLTWDNKTYTINNIKSLLIKYSKVA